MREVVPSKSAHRKHPFLMSKVVVGKGRGTKNTASKGGGTNGVSGVIKIFPII